MLHSSGEHISRLERMAKRVSDGGPQLSPAEEREICFIVEGIVSSRIWDDIELSEMFDLSKSTINKLAKNYPNIDQRTYLKLCSRLPSVLAAIRGSVISISKNGVSTTLVTIHNQHKKLSDVEGWYGISEEDFDQTFITLKNNLIKLISTLKSDNDQYVHKSDSKVIIKSALISLLETALAMLKPDGHVEVGFVRMVSKQLNEIARKSTEAAIGAGIKMLIDQVGQGLGEVIKSILK